jgi:hypothetical protein
MVTDKEYLKNVLGKLSTRDFCAVGSVLLKEDGSIDENWEGLKTIDEEIFNNNIVTINMSSPTGPEGSIISSDYFIGIAMQFYDVRSLSDEKEADAVISYFHEHAVKALNDLEKRVGSRGWKNFYLVTNLERSSLEIINEADCLIEKLSNARDGLSKKCKSNISNFGIFSGNDIIDAAWDYPNLEKCITDFGNQFGRLVFEKDNNGDVHINTALFSGINCVSIGDSNILSKISLPKYTSEDVLIGLEDLINSPNVKESDLQNFFELHPELLNMGEYAYVYPQLDLVREDGSVLRPDFVLEPASGPLCTIVDLKLPMKKLIVKTKNRQRFSAKIYEYIAQLREYSNYFDSYENRSWFRKTYGKEGLKPRLILVVGKDYPKEDYQLLNQLRPSIEPIKIITYDELIDRCRKQVAYPISD